jgi:ribosomal-protein-alanine N-acetyltransferase
VILAGPAHAGILAAIHGAVFPHEPWDEPSFATILSHPGSTAWLDPRGGLLVLRIAADEAEILTIGATAKRQGIGRALMREAIARARAQNVAAMHLEVAAGNAPARAFYTSFGFAQAGLRRRYYADGQDAVILTLRLEHQ